MIVPVPRFAASEIVTAGPLGPDAGVRSASAGKGAPMTVTGIITAIIIGAIVGALARLILPGKQNIGILITILVGIVAALIGTFIANAVGIATDTPGIDWGELVVQLVLAIIGVAIVAGTAGRGSSHRV
jgi:uncharacterized membrane protein YeaQ/YmgE (transglycosylase-associated protein family)